MEKNGKNTIFTIPTKWQMDKELV